jgi:hypothetical protein
MEITKGAMKEVMRTLKKIVRKVDSVITGSVFAVGSFAIAIVDESIFLVRKLLKASAKRLPNPVKVSSERTYNRFRIHYRELQSQVIWPRTNENERGDVPGWVLVVLMTTGLVTALWTIAAPRLSTILKNSLDAMNGIR